jgi:hypothetical protein
MRVAVKLDILADRSGKTTLRFSKIVVENCTTSMTFRRLGTCDILVCRSDKRTLRLQKNISQCVCCG